MEILSLNFFVMFKIITNFKMYEIIVWSPKITIFFTLDFKFLKIKLKVIINDTLKHASIHMLI